MDGDLGPLQCQGKRDSLLQKCMEDNAYSFNDIVLDTNLQGNVTPALGHGLFQLLTLLPGEVQFKRRESLMISLNNSLLYWVSFTDPDYNFITLNPKTVPRTMYRLGRNAGIVYIYLEVVLHRLINRADRPCESKPGYNFGDCVNDRVARDVGCQSFWSNLPNRTICSEEEDILNFINRRMEIQETERNELEHLTDCHKPCVFMEYKVRN